MKHLTAADRGKIEVLLQEQYANKEIAKKVGRPPHIINTQSILEFA